MDVITTKYHGPTDTKGGRISASGGPGGRVYRPYNHAITVAENHIAAACDLLSRANVKDSGRWVAGSRADGKGYVFVCDSHCFGFTNGKA